MLPFLGLDVLFELAKRSRRLIRSDCNEIERLVFKDGDELVTITLVSRHPDKALGKCSFLTPVAPEDSG